MNNKIVKTIAIVASIFTISPVVVSQERLNAKEAAEACKTKISDTYAIESEIRFSRNPASSLSAGAYKFWINTTEELDGTKSNVRYQCEITRTGELVGLTRESGRWNI